METTNPQVEEGTVPEESINLRHYWHVILERRWLIATIFVSMFALSLIYLFKATKIYEAHGQIEINRESDSVLNVKQVYAIDSKEQDYLQTQFKKLRSDTMLGMVITNLNLTSDARYGKSADPVRALGRDIQIVPIRLTRLVDVKAQHPDPKQAARIANSLMNSFIAENAIEKLNKSTAALTLLEAEAQKLQTNSTMAQKALEEYKNEKKMISLEGADQNMILQALKQKQAALDAAANDAAVAQRNWDLVSGLVGKGFPLDTIPEISADPMIQSFKKTIADKEGEWARVRSRYREHHPLYEWTRVEVEKLHSLLNEASTNRYLSIQINATIAAGKRDTLQKAVNEEEARLDELNEAKIQYTLLKAEADRNLRLWDDLITSIKGNQVQVPLNNMGVVDPAKVPLDPVKPRKLLTLLLGVFGGLVGSVGLAFFINYLDDSIKGQDDVETYLQLPFLGYIPNIKSNNVVARDLQVHLEPHSNAAEGFRTMRAAISLAYKPELLRTLAVTSTVPEEGKSLVTSNFAVVLAQTGMKTLLVDADLRRPSVHKSFQLNSPVGLSAYLMDKVNNVDEFIHTSEVPNLDIVCCGEVPENPSELIGSKRMKQFLQEVRTRYDRVLLDCPPVSAVSDPLILAAMSDGVVFVTKFNKVRREHARRSIRRLQDAGVPILGVVLNDIDLDSRDSYYYSYYYSQNKYYTSHYNPQSAANKGDKRKQG